MVYKYIENYENYLIFDDGVVFNTNSGKILQQTLKDKYLTVKLTNGSGRKLFYVHRLVASAFLSKPLDNLEVNHIDGNKSNNNVYNLEWCTHKENIIATNISAVCRGVKKTAGGFKWRYMENRS